MESETITVAPSVTLMLWTLWTLLATVCFAIAASKGRWGLLFFGFFTCGLTWIIGASVYAMPGSLWYRRFYSDWKQSRISRLTDGGFPSTN